MSRRFWFFGKKSDSNSAAVHPARGQGLGRTGDLPAEHWGVVIGTHERLAVFEAIVTTYFSSRGKPAQLDGGSVRIAPNHQYGLENILRTCAQSPEQKWKALVAAHFNKMERSEAHEVSGETLASVRDRLVVRLWDERVDAIVQMDVVRRADVPGMWTALAIDYPESIMTVNREVASGWKTDDGALFEIAMGNTLRLAKQRLKANFMKELGIYAVEGKTVFVSSLLLMLNQTDLPACKHGALVSIPSRSMLLYMPLQGHEALKNVQHILGLTAKIERETAGAVTDRVWWTKDGQFEELKYTLTGKNLEVNPGELMTAALQSIAG